MSRDLNKATPLMRNFAQELTSEVKRQLGLDIFIVDVDRDWKMQAAYYAQGRESLEQANLYRKNAGLPTITAEQNRHKITWTLKSKHIVNLDDALAVNNLSRAIDVGLKDKNGRYHGESQADLNGDHKRDYQQIGLLGEKIGAGKIKWGGRFGDEPHFEET